jgi:hypothetical protein
MLNCSNPRSWLFSISGCRLLGTIECSSTTSSILPERSRQVALFQFDDDPRAFDAAIAICTEANEGQCTWPLERCVGAEINLHVSQWRERRGLIITYVRNNQLSRPSAQSLCSGIYRLLRLMPLNYRSAQQLQLKTDTTWISPYMRVHFSSHLYRLCGVLR